MKPEDTPQASPTLADLYPSLTTDQLKSAEDNLRRYLELALRVYERIENDPDTHQLSTTLTESMGKSRIESLETESRNLRLSAQP